MVARGKSRDARGAEFDEPGRACGSLLPEIRPILKSAVRGVRAAALHLSHPWEMGVCVPCAVWVKRRTQRPDMTEAVNLTDVFACPAAWCFVALAMTAIGTVDR